MVQIMKIKLSEVLNLNQTLKLIIDDTQIKLEPLFKFKLLGIMKSLENPIENFEIIRQDKIKEYGKKSEQTGNIAISPDDTESIEKFQKDITQITESFVSIKIDKLKAKDVFNKGIKADYLIGLYPIIEE